MVPSGREDDGLVLLVSSHEVFCRLSGPALYEDFEGLAFVSLVAFGGEPALQFYYFAQSSSLDVVREVFAGVCSWPFGVLEHEGGVEGGPFHEAESLLVVFLGLSAEATEDVG